MDFSRNVNYQSDFDVLVRVVDAGNNAVGFPDFDFVLTFTTCGSGKVEAGQQDGVRRNVEEKDGSIHVVFNNHKLLPGKLNLEVRTNLTDPTYPDGKKLTVFRVPDTNIVLVNGDSDSTTGLVIDVKLPFAYQKESSSSSSSSNENTEG